MRGGGTSQGINPGCGAAGDPTAPSLEGHVPGRVLPAGQPCAWRFGGTGNRHCLQLGRGDPKPSKPGCVTRRALGMLKRFLQHAGDGLVTAQGSGLFNFGVS